MKLRIMTISLLTLATFLMPVASPKHASARPGCSVEKSYYSDDTFTTQVGDWNSTCDSGIIRSGHSTYYYDAYQSDCGGGCGSSMTFFRCENGTITQSDFSGAIGETCPNYPVF